MVLVPVLLGSTLGSLWAQPRVVTAGLPNLALSARAEATSSASSTYSADRATDGDLNTRWASDRYPSLPQTLTITFGEPITFTTVLILPVDMPSLYAWCKKVRVRAGEQTAEAEAGEGYQPILLRFEKPVTSSQVAVDIVQVHEPRDYVGIAEIMIFNDPEGKVRVLADWREEWLKADRTPHGRPVHPCVYITPEDVAYARELVKREAWAAKYLERVMKQAEEWLARSDEWIYTHTPPKGACFAYGVTGCPICGASFGTWLGARCSWDNPGHVVCENGHVLPDNEHPDPGTGYKAPDGRIHYFVGAYNAWVVEQYAFRGAANLAMAYTLTGDERYAQKCAVILDALADIYPTCTKGSWDYPSDPPSGRLNRPWYQVARVLVEYVDWYDRIFNSPALDTPSIRQGLTKRQNIEQNLLIDGAEYCYQCSLDRGKMGMALHNGCADYIRGALAVGCCLGIDTYVRWALDGPFGIRSLLANNVDRDGRYYETSVSYAEHTRGLYLTYAEPLLNYRSSEHPNGVDIYSWPHFSRFYRAPAAAIACAGHTPSFGDSAPDLSWAPADAPPISQEDVNHLLRAARSSAAEELLPLLGYLLGPRVPDFCSQYADPELLLFRSGLWRRLSALPGRTDDTQIGARTALFGQKGIAILRAGRGSAQQALLLRYGPSLNHGHFDDLGFNYYALGYELTYDLGYSMGSPHVQVGWAKQTAAHNLVVVNERPQGVAPGSGGSIFYLADLPGLQLVEADSPLSYSSEDVTVYRRCLALIGEPPDCYLLDIFRVGGGTQHDYFFHALSDKAEFSGLQLSDPQPGSLAGPDIRWADKVGNDGDIRGYPGKPYWNPPPGNGYGFLADVQKATTVGAQPWHVTWPIASSSARLTMTAAVDSETEILTAWAPGIRPRLPRSRYVILRRRGQAPLASTYACVYEPWTDHRPVCGVTAASIYRSYPNAPGELLYIPGSALLLWKSSGPDAKLQIRLPVPRAGSYMLVIRHYRSPAYGTLSVSVGRSQEHHIQGNAPQVGPAEPFQIGPIDLPAGEVALEMRVSEPSPSGDYWFGFQQIDLCTSGSQGPQVSSLSVITPEPDNPSRAWPVAVRVDRSGGADYLATCPPDAEGASDRDQPIRWSGLAFWRTSAKKPERLVLLAGFLELPGIRAELKPAFWRGRVSDVDYDKWQVTCESSVPADGRINGSLILFSNPNYSRNTAYLVRSVRSLSGGRHVIELSGEPTLGVLRVDNLVAAERRFESIIPHEYMRGLGRPTLFFAGKRLDAGGEPLAHIVSADYGAPCLVTVDTAERLREGQLLYVRDIQPGDEFFIPGSAAIDLTAQAPRLLAANTDVALMLEGKAYQLKWPGKLR